MGRELDVSGPPLTDAEDYAAQSALRALLGRQASLYTCGDSTSIPESLAQDLLSSLCFTLGLSPDTPPARWRAFLAAPDEALRAGLRRTELKKSAVRSLWKDACLTAPALDSRSLRDTLADIGSWLKSYDVRFFADTVPGNIDYQLCVPVPEELRGPDYASAYLRALLQENALLGALPRERVLEVLTRASPDYRDLLINLSEQPAVNAAGRVLLGLDPRPLLIPREGLRRLERMFGPLSPEDMAANLQNAAEKMCACLSLTSSAAVRYWRLVLTTAVPRMEAAVPAGGLENIFIPL